MRLEPDRLVRALRRLRLEVNGARLLLRSMPLRVHEVSYEQLRQDDARLLEVLAFLGVGGVDPNALTAAMFKLAPDSHRETIENFDEVRAALRNAGFGQLLRD